MYERNDTISFLSCGIALYVGGIVKDVNGLFYSSPAELEKIGVKTRMSCEIAEIDVGSKIFKVKNQKTNEIIEDSYDKLIVITGSWPIVPRIEVIDQDNILLSKNFYHSNTIIERVKEARNIIVVGAGYIGVEHAEAFRQYINYKGIIIK